MPEVDVELDRVATGGSALGPGPDGRLVFVAGALPGERVRATVDAEHRTRIEASVAAVHVASPGRRTPPCPHLAASREQVCGGCDWQHAVVAEQRELRRAIVVDCLTRLGRFADPDVRLGPPLDAEGYRTTVRMAVRRGRLGYRARRSHEVIEVDSCLVAHPLVAEIIAEGHFGDADEVTVRTGARTGERVVVVAPTAAGVRVPDDVVVVGVDELAAGRSVVYHEEIAGRRLQISAGSFFQCRPDGAEVLVDLVGRAVAGVDGRLLDAYCGVGLFGATLDRSDAASGGGPIGVESDRVSVADAAVNYERHCPPGAMAVRSRVERWRPQPVGPVVADPARAGLGAAAAEVLAATTAPVIALVSCDPASLARDARLLAGHGYDLDHVTVVDLFGQTSHVETVARFVATEPPSVQAR